MSGRHENLWVRLDLAQIDLGGPLPDIRFAREPESHVVRARSDSLRIVPDPPADEVPIPGTYPRLVWDAASGTPPPLPTEGCLDAFIRLHDAPSEKILRFAGKYGVLDVCRHWQLSGHHQNCWPLEHGFPIGWAPLEPWYRYARELWAALSIAAQLGLDRPGRQADWDAVVAADVSGRPAISEIGPTPRDARTFLLHASVPKATASLELQRKALTLVAKHWLGYGRCKPDVHLDHRQAFATILQYEGLAGTLAVKFLAALLSPTGIYICDECNNPYVPPKRRPPAGRRHYCPECSGDAEAGRGRSLAAKRAWWARARRASARARRLTATLTAT